MNKYTIQYYERKVITVDAETVALAEAKAFESDSWQTFVEKYSVSVSQTDDPKIIHDLFELDDDSDHIIKSSN